MSINDWSTRSDHKFISINKEDKTINFIKELDFQNYNTEISQINPNPVFPLTNNLSIESISELPSGDLILSGNAEGLQFITTLDIPLIDSFDENNTEIKKQQDLIKIDETKQLQDLGYTTFNSSRNFTDLYIDNYSGDVYFSDANNSDNKILINY